LRLRPHRLSRRHRAQAQLGRRGAQRLAAGCDRGERARILGICEGAKEDKTGAIHASEDLAAAREKAIRVIEKLRGLRLSRAAELVEAAVEETLTYYAFPGGALAADSHQQPARAHPARDPTAHACRGRVP
jgi:hypothetical protein